MKMIQVELEDWQALVYGALADCRGISTGELIRGILLQDAIQRVDSACRLLINTTQITCEIEHRLAELFRH